MARIVQPQGTKGSLKWIQRLVNERPELLNEHLPSDPGQEKDVINEKPEVARELHQMLVKFMTDNNLAPEMRDPRLELKL